MLKLHTTSLNSDDSKKNKTTRKLKKKKLIKKTKIYKNINEQDHHHMQNWGKN